MVFPKWPIETCILIFLEILTHMSVIALFCVCVCVCVHRVGGNWVGGGGGGQHALLVLTVTLAVTPTRKCYEKNNKIQKKEKDKLEWKTAQFRLPFVAQKRSCLSSLLRLATERFGCLTPLWCGTKLSK